MTKTTPMQWQKLLSDKRLGKTHTESERDRTAFQKDVDRIIFSSAFRRLQDKTQVFPLAQNDYVRTRLTHSLEVSSVGRSLGTLVGKEILKRHPEINHNNTNITAEDFGSIVAATCLAHDIGNPPFGHFGEEAIRDFFTQTDIGKSICSQVTDAQRRDGGMQLTYATLGAFTKYPCTQENIDRSNIATKKNGLQQGDIAFFQEIAQELGLKQQEGKINTWVRHPLVYLMEAADDICYAIIDIEDAYQVKQIDFDTAYSLLMPLTQKDSLTQLDKMCSNSDKLSYLRAKAIGNLIQQAAQVFLDREDEILRGEFNHSLCDVVPVADKLSQLTSYAAKNIYTCQPVVRVEIAGYRILHKLLELFCTACEDVAKSQQDDSYSAKAFNKMLINLLPARFIGKNRQLDTDCYERILKIVDYISGMTDGYAVHLYNELTGRHI